MPFSFSRACAHRRSYCVDCSAIMHSLRAIILTTYRLAFNYYGRDPLPFVFQGLLLIEGAAVWTFRHFRHGYLRARSVQRTFLSCTAMKSFFCCFLFYSARSYCASDPFLTVGFVLFCSDFFLPRVSFPRFQSTHT